MIKNIIFDLGNVLISFRPSEYFDKKDYSENMKARILTDIFSSEEWIRLDKGEISTKQAIDSIAARSLLQKEEIAHIFKLRTDIIFPLDNNVRLLLNLKKQGYRLFFLSNFPLDIFDEVKAGYYFFNFFDGGVISAEAHSSKPDSRIYEILLEKYFLLPDECLFIDDLEINVKTAEKLGIKGLVTFGSEEISKEVTRILSSFSH